MNTNRKQFSFECSNAYTTLQSIWFYKTKTLNTRAKMFTLPYMFLSIKLHQFIMN